MFSALKTIFGSSDVISKSMGLIDDIHTSEEEKIQADGQAKAALVAAKTKAKVSMLQTYAPFKVAQRFLAIAFTTVFLLSFVLSVVMTLMAGGGVSELKLILSEFYIGEIMLTIVIFYFGGGTFEGVISTRKTATK